MQDLEFEEIFRFSRRPGYILCFISWFLISGNVQPDTDRSSKYRRHWEIKEMESSQYIGYLSI